MTRQLLILLSAAFALHDGPDPVGSWRLSKEQVSGQSLTAVLGTRGRIEGKATFVDDVEGNAMLFDGKTNAVVLAEDFRKSQQVLPEKHLTLTAWVSVSTPERWGGIVGCVQDNGGAEKGWVLGYQNDRFSFGLATTGADDGDGRMTYVTGKTGFEPGRYYHVAATFDGEVQRLYINGKLDAESRVQSGAILYPQSAPLVIGAYRDADENTLLHGRIRSVRIFSQAAKPKAIKHIFDHGAALAREAPHVALDPDHRFVVHPYLQWARQREMTVRWETSRPASSVVHWAERVEFVDKAGVKTPVFANQKRVPGASMLHEVRLDGLRPETAYYYQVETRDDQGRVLRSPILSFQTAPEESTPFAFAVISDTQGNPEVSGAVARHAWALRPNFLLHPGDLVSTGSVKRQWISDFFASMRPLLERVALFPVLGNHEQDARFYYEYMSLPEPEHFYSFTYGNAHFFMLDSNRKVGPGSKQYAFLERELRASRAEWKIVCYHHPAYSSDENDYGDTWSGPSTRGDLRVRALVPLFDRHGVDIVWNGHIHSYERTWPLRQDRATQPTKGTIYMVTGGGGGSLERAGPIRPFFQNTVRRGHHFCFVAVNGKTLEMKAYDLEGRLFDTLRIQKP